MFLYLGLLILGSLGRAQPGPPAYPVKLSSDGLYLVDQEGRPFFTNGESAWSLIAQLSREDVEFYLENRRQKGFNLVLANLVEHRFSTNAPGNFYGVQPFTTSGNFGTPNEAYFAHADWVLTKAAEKGLVVLLDPLYLGWECGIDGWCAEVKASSFATMRSYGRYLGARYRSFPNIVWLVGGDTDPVANGVAEKVREFVEGVRENDTVHLFSAANAPEQAAVDPWPSEPWLNLNNIFTYVDAYPAALQQFNRLPFKPFFLLETYYENEHSSTPLSLRRQAYWTVLSGGILGHIFGNCEIWGFSRGYCTGPWKPQLESAGSQTLPLVGRLFTSRPFYQLVPDQTHQVLTSGYQSGSTYAATARTTNGSTIIAYVPTQRAVTIDLTKVAGSSAKAWWFNPRSGTPTLVGTFPTSGPTVLMPPDQNDWVLVVDDASLNLPAPGPFANPAPPSNLRIVR